MTSTNNDVIVLNYESEYDLVLDFSGSYDLPLYPYIENDITIEGLTLRSNLYGDELEPCIMYLETDSEITPYVIILNSSIMNQDDLLLTDLDPYLLSEIFKTNQENIRLALKTTCDLGSIKSIITPNNSDLVLSTDLNQNIQLQVFVETALNEIGIQCNSFSLTAISYLSVNNLLNFTLKNSMRKNVFLTVFLDSVEHPLTSFDPYYLTDLDEYLLSDIDYIDHAMKLTNSQLYLDIVYYLYSDNLTIPIDITLGEIYQSSTIYIVGNHTLHLTLTDIETYIQQYFSEENFTMSLNEDDISIYIKEYAGLERNVLPLKTGLDYKEFLMTYDPYYLSELDNAMLIDLDGADNYIHLETYITYDGKLGIKTGADLTINTSPDLYDTMLLVDLDPYTIDDLEQEIIS